MRKTALSTLLGAALLLSAPAFAIDGQILINQSIVNAAGGFPYTINQPGSYKLSGNLVVTGETNGITINANNVTLDLNGFTISGPNTCSGSGISISCTNTALYGIYAGGNEITVQNGTVSGFAIGILLIGSDGIIERVHATSNFAWGIASLGGGVVRDNTASFNGQVGIEEQSSTVTDNVANFNGEFGLHASYGVYGSNTFDNNGSVGVSNFGTAISQNNNDCNGTTC